MFYAASEAEAEYSSTQWVEAASVSGKASEGDYKLFINCEYAGTIVDETVGARVLIDGTEMAFDHYKPVLANQYRTFNSFIMAQFLEGEHTVTLEVRCLTPTQSVKVRRKRLLVEKH